MIAPCGSKSLRLVGGDLGVLIQNARVFDGDRAVSEGLQNVAIEAGRITDVGSHLTRDHEVETIDARGCWLIPGLIDTHVHSTFLSEVDVYLRNSVTSIRFAGNPPGIEERFAQEIADAGRAAPRIFSCGPMLDSSPLSYPSYSVRVDTVEEMERAALQLVDAGVDAFIVVQHIRAPLLEALAPIARAHRLPVVGQIWAIDAAEAARAGISQLDNTSRILASSVFDGSLPASVADRIERMRAAWLRVDWDGTRRLIDAMVASGVSYCPTLVRMQWVAGLAPGTFETLDADRDVAAFDDAARAFWRERVAVGQISPETLSLVRDEWRRAVSAVLEWISLFHEAGGQLTVGTDSQFGGITIHHELANLEAAGLSPAEVLRAATGTSGRALGARVSTGRIVPGALADVVLIGGDPTVDLAALRDPLMVIADGKVVFQRHVDAASL